MFKPALLAILMVPLLALGSSPSMACACCGTWKVSRVAAGDVLNIRSGPGPHYNIVGQIPSGSGCVVKTGKCIVNWCAISYADQKGWVSNRYLSYIK